MVSFHFITIEECAKLRQCDTGCSLMLLYDVLWFKGDDAVERYDAVERFCEAPKTSDQQRIVKEIMKKDGIVTM